MTPNLESAIALAAMAHNGQTDKGGHPYILHPLRVMAGLERDPNHYLHELMAAVLHDVPEDNPFYPLIRFWYDGYPVQVCDALDALSRRRDEDYETFIARCQADRIARRVKIADLEDNMNLSRIGSRRSVTAEDLERTAKYQKAWEFLTGRKVSTGWKIEPGKMFRPKDQGSWMA